MTYAGGAPEDQEAARDSSQARYDAEAAALAWKRTLAFFENYLVQHR